MRQTELFKKDYVSPEISSEDIAVENGFAASTQELTDDPDAIMWL